MLTGNPATRASRSSNLQGGNLAGALERMLALEKRTRVAGDSYATSKVAVEIVRTCWEVKDLEQLNAHILILSKRRAQLKQAIADIVKEAMTYIEQVTSRDAKLALVTTLRTVADGKIYVEVRAGFVAVAVSSWGPPWLAQALIARPHHSSLAPVAPARAPQVERARLTMMLAKMHEERGAIAEASETLQEIAVETYGSMEKREKAEFLLEQVRLFDNSPLPATCAAACHM